VDISPARPPALPAVWEAYTAAFRTGILCIAWAVGETQQILKSLAVQFE
jgi:hypothetical protein